MIVLDPDLDPPLVPATAPSSSLKQPPTRKKTSRELLNSAPLERMPSPRALASFLHKAQAAVRLRGQVTVLLTTDTTIRRLNRQFRGKNKATDVLSFPASQDVTREIAGDLAISVPTARGQAREQGHRLATEIKVLMLHGLLHLAGYDHEADSGQMARRELRLRSQLRLPHGLIERVTGAASTVKPAAPSRRKLSAAVRKTSPVKPGRP